jgi:hypothetical protein
MALKNIPEMVDRTKAFCEVTVRVVENFGPEEDAGCLLKK